MAWFSGGRNNDELVGNLRANEVIESDTIAHAFYSVDRKLFCTLDNSDTDENITTENKDNDLFGDMLDPTGDQPYKHKYIHLSAPHIYALILENLHIQPGMSVLNIGSGSGYLSSIVACLLGPYGINHGIELHPDATRHSRRCFKALKQKLDLERQEYDNTFGSVTITQSHTTTDDEMKEAIDTTQSSTKPTDSTTTTSTTTSTSTATTTTSTATRANRAHRAIQPRIRVHRIDDDDNNIGIGVEIDHNSAAFLHALMQRITGQQQDNTDTENSDDDTDLVDNNVLPMALLQTILMGGTRQRRRSQIPTKPVLRPPELCNTTFINGNGFSLNVNNTAMRYDRIYIGAACKNEQITFFIQFLNVNGTLISPNDVSFADTTVPLIRLIQIQRLCDYMVVDGTTGIELERSTSDTTSNAEPATLAHWGQPHIQIQYVTIPQLTLQRHEYHPRTYIYLYNTVTHIKQRYIQSTISTVGFASMKEPKEYILNSIDIPQQIFEPMLYNVQTHAYKSAIDSMLMLQRRQSGVIAKLPMSILLNIFEYCHRQWFESVDNTVYDTVYNQNQHIIQSMERIYTEAQIAQSAEQYVEANEKYDSIVELLNTINPSVELSRTQLNILKPLLSSVYINMHICYKNLARTEKLGNLVKHALNLNPNNITALLIAAQHNLDTGDLETALSLCKRALTIQPNNTEITTLLDTIEQRIQILEANRIAQRRDEVEHKTNDTTDMTNGVSEIDPEHHHSTVVSSSDTDSEMTREQI